MQIITCKAVVCWGPGEAPAVEEIRVEPPRSGEVRIKMLFASLCHTDVLCCKGFPTVTPQPSADCTISLFFLCFQFSFYFPVKSQLISLYFCEFAWQPVFPRVLGHEGVGMVECVGEGVSRLREGDIVIPTYLGECRECENCLSGRTNLCQTYPLQAFTGLMPDGSSRMSTRAGKMLYQFLSCSTWSQYTVVDANYAVKIDSGIPLAHASFLSCGFTTGFGAAWKEATVQEGSSVAILGLGAVGLGAVEGARVHGAARIIGIDINESKREKGEAFGMTHFINPKASHKSIPELVKELTNGGGVDVCFECTGVPDLVDEALESTKVGTGNMIMLGAGTQKSLTINFVSLLGCRTFKYAVFGGVKVQSDLPVIIEKCLNKEIQKLDQLLTHEVHLEDINRAFELLKEPDCLKVLITL